METHHEDFVRAAPFEARSHPYPVDVHVATQLGDRNRLTTAFRLLLAIPHLILVGGPPAFVTFGMGADNGRFHLGATAGALSGVAAVITIIAWIAIIFGGRHPEGLWNLAAFYLRWRVRAVAYFTLVRDEYPPFGDEAYPAALTVVRPEMPRNRLTVALRPILVIPHLVVLWILGFGWAIATVIAWFSILIFGKYPVPLSMFATGMLRWETRVEAYALLLRDEYPPFSFE